MEEVLQRPNAEEMDDYKEFKRIRHKVRERQRPVILGDQVPELVDEDTTQTPTSDEMVIELSRVSIDRQTFSSAADEEAPATEA